MTKNKKSITKSKNKESDADEVGNYFNVMKYKWWYIGFSALALVFCILFLVFYGLRLSIDFTGGSVLSFRFGDNALEESQVKDVALSLGVEVVEISKKENGRQVVVKTKPIDSDKNEEIKRALLNINSNIEQVSFESVGSVIGKETAKKSIFALFVACVGIVLYIAYAFRNIPKPYSSFRFGISAIIAMIHDVLVVVGVFSFLGYYKGVEVDLMFVTALLTIIGFSVHDTIVVFDRIRENLLKFKKDIEWVANYSVLETMRRSIATSLTVVLTLIALLFFGGESTRYFVLALLIGVISGTYSSIFNATPILVIWESWVLKTTRSFPKKM